MISDIFIQIFLNLIKFAISILKNGCFYLFFLNFQMKGNSLFKEEIMANCKKKQKNPLQVPVATSKNV